MKNTLLNFVSVIGLAIAMAVMSAMPSMAITHEAGWNWVSADVVSGCTVSEVQKFGTGQVLKEIDNMTLERSYSSGTLASYTGTCKISPFGGDSQRESPRNHHDPL